MYHVLTTCRVLTIHKPIGTYFFSEFREKVLDGLHSCSNIYSYSKESDQLKHMHFQKSSRIPPIVLEAKAGYVITTNRAPKNLTTSKELCKHTVVVVPCICFIYDLLI